MTVLLITFMKSLNKNLKISVGIEIHPNEEQIKKLDKIIDEDVENSIFFIPNLKHNYYYH